MSVSRAVFWATAACLLAAVAFPLRAQCPDGDSHPTCRPCETFRHGEGDCPPQASSAAELAAASWANDDGSMPDWQPAFQPQSGKRYWKGVWIATWVAFVAVNVLDAHSSSGRLEANPLLRDGRGIFSGRKALLVKSAAGGGFFALQAWLAQRRPGENHYQAFSVATGAATAALGAVAVRNYGVERAAAAQTAPAAPAYLLRKP
jgi:hypothetical protein